MSETFSQGPFTIPNYIPSDITNKLYSDGDDLYWEGDAISLSTHGSFFMQSNGTATSVANTTDYYKLAGTTTSIELNNFTMPSNNRLTYTASKTRTFQISVTSSILSVAGNIIDLAIFKNGVKVDSSQISSVAEQGGVGKADNMSLQCILSLVTNDYVELWSRNETNNNDITLQRVQFIIKEI